MASRSPTVWLGACAAAALLLVAVVLVLSRHAKQQRTLQVSSAVVDGGAGLAAVPAACGVAMPTLHRADTDAESPPGRT